MSRDLFNKTKKERKEFALEILRNYKELGKNINFCKKMDFTNSVNSFIELQIGKLLHIEKIFNTEENLKKGIRIDNSILAQDFAESMHLGLINFILQSVFNTVKPQKNTIEFSFENFKELRNIEKITDIFIPIDLIQNIYSWVKYSALEFGETEILVLNDNKIRIHWLPKEFNFDELILINSDSINLIRKKVNQIKEIKSFKNYERFGEDYLDIRMGLKDNKLALLLRTVSKVIVKKEGVIRYKVKILR